MEYHGIVMTNKNKPKRMRGPGAGRKPSGPITGKTQNFSTRITEETRGALEVEKALSGHSISQVAERLLRLGLEMHRSRENDDPTRALNYLIGTLASICSGVRRDGTRREWNNDRSVFEAFRLAIIKLLEYLKPIGEVDSSLDGPLVGQSPDQRAEYAFREILAALQAEPINQGDVVSIQLEGEGFADALIYSEVGSPKTAPLAFRTMYAFSHARRALKLKSDKPDKE
jgi:hypothetical protein